VNVTVAIKSGTGAVGATLLGTISGTTDASGSVTFSNLSIDLVGANYRLTATGSSYGAVDSATFNITPGNLLSDVVAADPNFQKIDGFDVLFGKGSATSAQKLKNTNPATFHYNLTLTNETGTTIHAKNVAISDKYGASAYAILTVPGLPGSVGTPLPSGLGPTDPAFILSGNNAIHVHPDDKTDDMPVTISYSTTPVADCTTVSTWTPGTPPAGTAVKCIKIEGFAIPKHGKAKIDVNYEFRFKNTDGWALNAQQTFRAGFAFKSFEGVTFDPTFPITSLQGKTYTGNQAVGLVGAGQQSTAVGGFVFDTAGQGLSGILVKLYNAAPATADCLAVGTVATAITDADGFYFIETTTTSALLPSGVQYFTVVCNPTNAAVAGRMIDHKLANKEFDEEDFYLNLSNHLVFGNAPPVTIKKGVKFAPAVTVRILNASNAVVSTDNSTAITLTLGANPANGNLGGKVTATVVNGVATFNDLQIDKVGNGYTIIVSSSPGMTEITSGFINVTS
jgi:hypothetical protein